jgi:CBS domain-containing protein
VIFALELTHDVNMLVPLLLAVTIAHGFTVLTLRRSILTEKVARRGFHLSREYAVDPLEILFVREVMRSNVIALEADATSAGMAGVTLRQPLYPVIDEGKSLVGVITRQHLQRTMDAHGEPDLPFAEMALRNPVVAYADEPLRLVVNRMAESGFTRFPVVEREDSRTLVGMVSLSDLLRARTRSLEEERHRERVLRIRLPFGTRRPPVKQR